MELNHLTTREAATLLASSDLETEKERYLRVLHCVFEGRRPESADLVSALLLCEAFRSSSVPQDSSRLLQLVLLWEPLVLIARVYYSCLEVAA